MDLYARSEESDETDAAPSIAAIEIEADAELDTLLRIVHMMTMLNLLPDELHWDTESAGRVRIRASVPVRAAQAATLSRRLAQLWQVRMLTMTHAENTLRWEDGGERQEVTSGDSAASAAAGALVEADETRS